MMATVTVTVKLNRKTKSRHYFVQQSLLLLIGICKLNFYYKNIAAKKQTKKHYVYLSCTSLGLPQFSLSGLSRFSLNM